MLTYQFELQVAVLLGWCAACALGIPLRQELAGTDPPHFSEGTIAAIVSVTVLACIILIVAGCGFCKRMKFKQLRHQNGVAVPRRHSNRLEAPRNLSEFTIFPPPTVAAVPPSLSRHEDEVTFEPLPDIRLRGQPASAAPHPPRLAHSSNVASRELSSYDWSDEPNVSFPRNQLSYLRELGNGWFGRVVEGEAINIVVGQPKTHVVVKILREDATPTEHGYFLHEVHPFRDLHHPNIVAMLGRCLDSNPFLIIMEHCVMDLKTYLIQHCEDVENLLQNGLLLRMACNIAAALRHMHEHGFIHTDLATRNCLVSSDLIVKVGDYGTSIQAFKDDYYYAGDVAVPIRWSAPESISCTDTIIEMKEVTREANIWSFGIVLWELLELGKLPYSELSNEDVLQRVIVDAEVKLKQPQTLCIHRDRLYQIMNLCWEEVPWRPMAQKLVLLLSHLYDNRDVPPDAAAFEARWNALSKQPPIREHNLDPSVTVDISGVVLGFESDFVSGNLVTSALKGHSGSRESFVSGASDSERVSFREMSPSFSSFTTGLDASFVSNISPSLQNLHGSIEDLSALELDETGKDLISASVRQTEVGSEVDAKNEAESVTAQQISDVIRHLDSILAAEATSSADTSQRTTPERVQKGELQGSQQIDKVRSGINWPLQMDDITTLSNDPISSEDSSAPSSLIPDSEKSTIDSLLHENPSKVAELFKLTVIESETSSDADSTQPHSLQGMHGDGKEDEAMPLFTTGQRLMDPFTVPLEVNAQNGSVKDSAPFSLSRYPTAKDASAIYAEVTVHPHVENGIIEQSCNGDLNGTGLAKDQVKYCGFLSKSESVEACVDGVGVHAFPLCDPIPSSSVHLPFGADVSLLNSSHSCGGGSLEHPTQTNCGADFDFGVPDVVVHEASSQLTLSSVLCSPTPTSNSPSLIRLESATESHPVLNFRCSPNETETALNNETDGKVLDDASVPFTDTHNQASTDNVATDDSFDNLKLLALDPLSNKSRLTSTPHKSDSPELHVALDVSLEDIDMVFDSAVPDCPESSQNDFSLAFGNCSPCTPNAPMCKEVSFTMDNHKSDVTDMTAKVQNDIISGFPLADLCENQEPSSRSITEHLVESHHNANDTSSNLSCDADIANLSVPPQTEFLETVDSDAVVRVGSMNSHDTGNALPTQVLPLPAQEFGMSQSNRDVTSVNEATKIINDDVTRQLLTQREESLKPEEDRFEMKEELEQNPDGAVSFHRDNAALQAWLTDLVQTAVHRAEVEARRVAEADILGNLSPFIRDRKLEQTAEQMPNITTSDFIGGVECMPVTPTLEVEDKPGGNDTKVSVHLNTSPQNHEGKDIHDLILEEMITDADEGCQLALVSNFDDGLMSTDVPACFSFDNLPDFLTDLPDTSTFRREIVVGRPAEGELEYFGNERHMVLGDTIYEEDESVQVESEACPDDAGTETSSTSCLTPDSGCATTPSSPVVVAEMSPNLNETEGSSYADQYEDLEEKEDLLIVDTETNEAVLVQSSQPNFNAYPHQIESNTIQVPSANIVCAIEFETMDSPNSSRNVDVVSSCSPCSLENSLDGNESYAGTDLTSDASVPKLSSSSSDYLHNKPDEQHTYFNSNSPHAILMEPVCIDSFVEHSVSVPKHAGLVLEGQEVLAGSSYCLESSGNLDTESGSAEDCATSADVSSTPASSMLPSDESPCREMYTPDFDSDTDDTSSTGTSCGSTSTSGSFECLQKLGTSGTHSKEGNEVTEDVINKGKEGESLVQTGEDCGDGQMRTSMWDRYATPTKSSMKSPERKVESTKKNVSFNNDEDPQVYSYPPDVEAISNDLQDIYGRYRDMWQRDNENFDDWDLHSLDDEIPEEIVQVDEADLDDSDELYRRYRVLPLRPLHGTVFYSLTGFSDDDSLESADLMDGDDGSGDALFLDTGECMLEDAAETESRHLPSPETVISDVDRYSTSSELLTSFDHARSSLESGSLGNSSDLWNLATQRLQSHLFDRDILERKTLLEKPLLNKTWSDDVDGDEPALIVEVDENSEECTQMSAAGQWPRRISFDDFALDNNGGIGLDQPPDPVLVQPSNSDVPVVQGAEVDVEDVDISIVPSLVLVRSLSRESILTAQGDSVLGSATMDLNTTGANGVFGQEFGTGDRAQPIFEEKFSSDKSIKNPSDSLHAIKLAFDTSQEEEQPPVRRVDLLENNGPLVDLPHGDAISGTSSSDSLLNLSPADSSTSPEMPRSTGIGSSLVEMPNSHESPDSPEAQGLSGRLKPEEQLEQDSAISSASSGSVESSPAEFEPSEIFNFGILSLMQMEERGSPEEKQVSVSDAKDSHLFANFPWGSDRETSSPVTFLNNERLKIPYSDNSVGGDPEVGEREPAVADRVNHNLPVEQMVNVILNVRQSSNMDESNGNHSVNVSDAFDSNCDKPLMDSPNRCISESNQSAVSLGQKTTWDSDSRDGGIALERSGTTLDNVSLSSSRQRVSNCTESDSAGAR